MFRHLRDRKKKRKGKLTKREKEKLELLEKEKLKKESE